MGKCKEPKNSSNEVVGAATEVKIEAVKVATVIGLAQARR